MPSNGDVDLSLSFSSRELEIGFISFLKWIYFFLETKNINILNLDLSIFRYIC